MKKCRANLSVNRMKNEAATADSIKHKCYEGADARSLGAGIGPQK